MQWMAVFTEEDTLSDGDDDAAEAWGYVQHRNLKVTLEVISPTAHHKESHADRRGKKTAP
jgi:hypothetical protein